MLDKTLFLHQEETVLMAVSHDDDFLTEKPTGGGKTYEIVAVACLSLCKGYKVVITTPQQHIEQAFVARPYDGLILPTSGDRIHCPAELIRASRAQAGKSIKSLLGYLAGPAAPGYALACTHAAMALINAPADEWASEALPESLEKCLLLVDEAHHTPADRLSQITELWRRRGGRVGLYTATAWRHDRDPVRLLPNPKTGRAMVVYRRTLAQHMEEGFAPERVETEVVAVKVDAVSVDEFEGKTVPKEEVQKMIVGEMVKRWKDYGRPKLVVRVPVMTGTSGTGPATATKTAAMVAGTVAAFTAAGARVLDVSGQAPEDKKRFLTALPEERTVTHYNLSGYDVLVGVQRVNEGMDWPLCSTVFVVGFPTSLTLITQLLGRATRLKAAIAGYPADHAARARLTMFVPCSEPSAELIAHHRRSTVLMCAHLENATSAGEWAVVKEIGRGVIRPMSDRPIGTAAATAAYPTDTVDPVFRAEAMAVFAHIRSNLLASGSLAPDAEVLERAYAEMPQVPRKALNQVMVEFVVQEAGMKKDAKTLDKVRTALLEEIAARQAKGDDLTTAIRSAFDAVVAKLDSYAVCQSTCLARIDTNLIRLTGADIRAIGFCLAEARPLTPDWLAGVVAQFHAGNGHMPSAKTKKAVPGWADETWERIDQAISNRKRGWPLLDVSNLAQFTGRYAARGSVGDLLEAFRAEGRLTPAEGELLTGLADQRVKFGQWDVMPFKYAPAPAQAGAAWPRPNWWVIDAWRAAGGAAWKWPLADLYAAVLAHNLAQWLHARRGYSLAAPKVGTPTLDLKYARAELRIKVRAETWVDRQGLVFKAGQEYSMRAAKTPCAQSNPLARRDGAKAFSRSAHGYAEAAIQAAPYITPGCNPSKEQTETLSAESAVPLTWVVEVNGAKVPADWAGVRGVSAEPVSKPPEAA